MWAGASTREWAWRRCREPMQLSVGARPRRGGRAGARPALGLCRGLYMGQLELDVELVPEDDGTAAGVGLMRRAGPPPSEPQGTGRALASWPGGPGH